MTALAGELKIINKWYHTYSSKGCFIEAYIKFCRLGKTYYTIEVYYEENSDIWKIMFSDKNINNIYDDMFKNCCEQKFRNHKEARDVMDYFLEKLDKLAVFL